MFHFLKYLLFITIFFIHFEASATYVCSKADIPEGYVVTQIDYGPSDASACYVSSNYSPIKYTIKIPSTSEDVCLVDGIVPNGYVIAYTREDYNYCKPSSSAISGTRVRIKIPTNQFEIICTGSDIPSGYVVTRKRDQNYCGSKGAYALAYEIQMPPASGIVMCTAGVTQSVPPNFVITEKDDNYNNCYYNGSLGYGQRIEILTANYKNVCDPSPLPTGYIITAKGNNFNRCASDGGQGYGATYTKALTDGPYDVCDPSPLPDGYVIFKRDDYSQCSGSGTGPGYQIQKPTTSSLVVCDGSPIPTGYVITGRDNYSKCARATSSTRPGFTIQIPSQTGTTTVCSGSPVPDGYGFTASGQYSQCAASGTGYGYEIGPITDGSVVCSGSSIPSGYIISSIQSYNNQCDSGDHKGYTLRIPQPDQLNSFCSGSTHPGGYVIVPGTNSNCDGRSGWYIKRPATSGNTQVCGDSPIPDTYITIASASNSQCATSSFTYTIQKISGDGPHIVCAESNIPAGFLITSYSYTSASCQAGIVQNQSMTLGKISSEGTTQICPTGNDVIPPEYVIIKRTNTSQCGNIATHYDYIALPDFASNTRVCYGSNLPEGFVEVANTTNSNDSNCLGISYEIRPLLILIEPVEFLDDQQNITLPVTPPAYLCNSSSSQHSGFQNSAQKNTVLCQ